MVWDLIKNYLLKYNFTLIKRQQKIKNLDNSWAWLALKVNFLAPHSESILIWVDASWEMEYLKSSSN